VTDCGGGRIVKLDREGTVLTALGPDAGFGFGPLGHPVSIAPLPDGDLYVCDLQGGRVLRVGYR
jgi:glucose/arabinose dehydrogenase